MKTTGELLRRLVASHVAGDDAAFAKTVDDVVQEERRKNHHLLANDIRKIAKNGSDDDSIRGFSLLPSYLPRDVPHDERGLPLIRVFEANRTFEQLVLRRGIAASLGRIVKEIDNSDLLRINGLQPRKKILFYGPPGCGKTISAEALASALMMPVMLVRFDAVVSSYLGETAANLSRVFEYAETRPAVLLFDEFDAIGKSRDSDEEHGELKRVVNSFLQMLDAFQSPGLVVAATNHEGLLDSALWRRFDDAIEFPRPTKGEIESLLRLLLRNFDVSGLDLPSLISTSAGLSHADVERAVRDAMKTAVLAGRRAMTPAELSAALAAQVLRVKRQKRVGRQRSPSG